MKILHSKVMYSICVAQKDGNSPLKMSFVAEKLERMTDLDVSPWWYWSIYKRFHHDFEIVIKILDMRFCLQTFVSEVSITLCANLFFINRMKKMFCSQQVTSSKKIRQRRHFSDSIVSSHLFWRKEILVFIRCFITISTH